AALQRESARIAAILRAAAAAARRSGRSPSFSSGRLLQPVQGRLSSTFGMRFDPVYHVWRLHAGVDFAAPRGTPIFAAASGVVINAGWAGGYGNYTCISHGTYHGQGLATCYGHQSAILVHAGQGVSRGQLIGRVGTTGDSTGNHLHFEVRLDGRPVNPLPWL
ncbi:MAG: M23 family metallopeptidase, partial [Mycobacteriales bacterium]